MSGGHRSPEDAPGVEQAEGFEERHLSEKQPAEQHGRRSGRRTPHERGTPRHVPDVRRRVVPRAGVIALVSGVLVLTAAATAAAVFLDRGSAGAGVASGTVIVDVDATGATTVPVPITGLLPGGTAQRLLDVTHAGTVPLSALQLATSTATSSSDGLQLTVERCSLAWSADAATCAGTVSTVTADRPSSSHIDLPGSPALAVGATDHLRLTLHLAESAPSSAQSTSATLTVTVVGVQRPGRHL